MQPLTIGIAGATGSGKSTVARKLIESLPEGAAVILDHDAYYRDQANKSLEERAQVNFDHPASLDNALLVSHLEALKRGEAIDKPIYDFTSHTRAPETVALGPAAIVVVEGILIFADPILRNALDVKIWVETADDIRVFRRIRRDMKERGRDFESIRKQYYETVRPMHLKYVAPTVRYADIIVPEGGTNRVALDLLVGKLLRFIEEPG